MSSSALENEDLENVPLVRMEDVQPSRDRIDRCVDIESPVTEEEEVYETCIIDEVDYEKDCMLDEDSDSNIGSMVSIQSEEIPDVDDDNAELIVPEVLDPPIEIELPIEVIPSTKEAKPNEPDSWPTLEILPGGVIKKPNKNDNSECPARAQSTKPKMGEMVYACAKCSQAFKYLFCLVKHVKWHEDQEKIMMDPHLKKLTPLEKELIYIRRERNVIEKAYKKQKVEIMSRIADAIGNINNAKTIFK